jgi:hypothetical protein
MTRLTPTIMSSVNSGALVLPRRCCETTLSTTRLATDIVRFAWVSMPSRSSPATYVRVRNASASTGTTATATNARNSLR